MTNVYSNSVSLVSKISGVKFITKEFYSYSSSTYSFFWDLKSTSSLSSESGSLAPC